MTDKKPHEQSIPVTASPATHAIDPELRGERVVLLTSGTVDYVLHDGDGVPVDMDRDANRTHEDRPTWMVLPQSARFVTVRGDGGVVVIARGGEPEP